jgi:hypothetical protein
MRCTTRSRPTAGGSSNDGERRFSTTAESSLHDVLGSPAKATSISSISRDRTVDALRLGIELDEPAPGVSSASALLDLSLHAGENQSLQLHFAARIVDVDSNKASISCIVKYDARGDLATFDAGRLREIDIELVGIGVVPDLHLMNPRSGNALWIVTWSSRVTTRRYRPCNSGGAGMAACEVPRARNNP